MNEEQLDDFDSRFAKAFETLDHSAIERLLEEAVATGEVVLEEEG